MKQQSLPFSIRSFAKLNLYLKILNKRKDGFHNLNSLFCRVDLADKITLRNRKDKRIVIECNDPEVPAGRANLCWKAADLLRRQYGLKQGIDIKIEKKIPVGGGLGGGSSNAASVLMGLDSYWKLHLSQKRMANLAAKIGSDVAFFTYNTKFAEVCGRGQIIKPVKKLDKLKLRFIIIYPKKGVSTALVYRKWDDFSRLTMPGTNVKIITSELLKKGAFLNAKNLFNDLEIITLGLYPVIKQVKKAFYGIGLEKNLMSGSGSAVFSLCSSFRQAKNLGRILAKRHRSWQVFAASCI